MINIVNKIRFRLIRRLSMKKLRSLPTFDKDAIYITFDDGPEPGITEFVIEELKRYNVKATFFCCGKNCHDYPELFNRIIGEGHSVANHTHSHISGYSTSTYDYIENVEKCEEYLGTNTFRPPWGALTFKLYNILKKKYRIIYWDLSSDDAVLKKFNINKAIYNLSHNSKPGSIVLFHFCKKHENETKQILPLYLKYIKEKDLKTNTF